MIEITVADMTCGGCVASITRVVQGLDPDAKVEANVETKRVKINSVGYTILASWFIKTHLPFSNQEADYESN